VNAFGVDLLYEGLMLEIDGHSIKREKQEIKPAGSSNWMRFEDYPVAVMSGSELYVGGLSAPGAASLLAQTEASIDRLNLTLRAAGLGYESLIKVTVFYVPDEEDEATSVETIATALGDYIPGPGPVLSVVRVKNLPFPGQRMQLDAVAVR
jgi:enamine deaminase RidA (YjgF/YER057c/UK114 family)